MINAELAVRRPKLKNISRMFLGILRNFFTLPHQAAFRGRLEDLSSANKLVVVYIGHATCFINLFGTTILTDPVFGSRIFGVIPRQTQPGLNMEQLPELDYILISHAHYDHLHKPSLRKLAPHTKKLVVPKNCTNLVADLGFREIIEANWGDSVSEIKVIRPEHWGTRLPWDKILRGYNSYILSKKRINILFAGDTAYSQDFINSASQFSIDIALLPITAYNPVEFQKSHMHPEDAVRTFKQIGAKYFIPIHWGTFSLSLEPMDEPPALIKKYMSEEGISDKLKLLNPGEFFQFENGH